ncbi:MAG: (Fe-S)-binding protein [Candidatus Hydrogenedentota bacterium]|nr:MAG: (Fe-S)-binding protein [Candidatus Hydrogenedentota bacterium]
MVDASEKYRELAELSHEISRCGRCGFCQSVCPVYHVSANETGVARGRNMYAKELISGRLEFAGENEAFFSECLLCHACVDICFSAVKTDEIVLAGRRTRRRIRGISPAYGYAFEHLLPDQRRLGRLVRLASAGRSAGLGKLAPALRMFGWFGRSVARAEQLFGELPKQFLRERLAQREAAPELPRQAALFIGCGINFMFPHVGEATVRILEMLGYDVAVVEHGCCGLPAFVQGDTDAARIQATKNIDVFSSVRDGIIASDCSSCASFLKDYPRLFPTGNAAGKVAKAEAEAFSSRVRDITELLAGVASTRTAILRKSGPPGSRSVASFHDPCHLSRRQRLSQQARDVLRSLPDIEFVEMNEADWCCGGAGTFAVEHPELSLRILERKIENVKSSGADTLATTCPSCLMQIQSGLRDAGLMVRARHLVEIVSDCLSSG